MDRCINDQSPSAELNSCVGARLNFTEKLGVSCASVQRLHFSVRDDVADAVDVYIRKLHQGVNDTDKESNVTILGWDAASLSRPTDVRTFWNKWACNSLCAFRSQVSDAVASIPERYPSIAVNTEIVGSLRKRGRAKVHPEYIRAMLETKIIGKPFASYAVSYSRKQATEP